MSVTAVKIARGGFDGKYTAGEIGKYSVTYLVDTSSVGDGPEIILNSPLLPQVGSYYNAGNDIDFTSTLQGRSVSQVSGNRWKVKCDFGPRKDEGSPKVDENGNPTDNPLEERAVFSIESRMQTRILERTVYAGQAKESPLGGTVTDPIPIGTFPTHRAVGQIGPITNSALVPFDPPPEVEYGVRVLKIRRPAAVWSEDFLEIYNNSVNKTEVYIPHLNLLIPPGAGKLTNSGSEEDKNGLIFWRESYEIQIDKFFGFWIDIMDRGYSARALEYDLDEDGNTIQRNAVKENSSGVRRLTDQNGRPVSEPQMLNGDGRPLKKGEDPVFLRYEHPKMLDWSPLQLESRTRVF